MLLRGDDDVVQSGDLSAWRELAARAVLNAVAMVGLLATLGAGIWCYITHDWTQLAAVGVIAAMLIPVVLIKRLPLLLRINALVLVCYATGLVQVFTGAPFGTAVLLFLVAAAMAGILLDTRMMLFWVIVAVLTVSAFSGAMGAGYIHRQATTVGGMEWWILWSVSFALLTTAVVVPQRMLIGHISRMVAQTTAHHKTLADSEQRTQTIFDSVSDAIFIYDIDTGSIVESNEAACRMWKCNADEISRMTLGDSCLGDSPYSAVEARQWMAKAIRDEPCVFEWRSRDATGQVFWTEMTIRRATIGEHMRLVVTARDIDMRKRAEEALLQANRELTFQKYAVDQHAIVAMTDSRGRITYVNDHFVELSGYSRDELLGQDHRLLNSGHHPKAFFKDMYATISSGNVWRGEIRNRAKAGHYYWVDTTIVPFPDEHGHIASYVAIRTDISERVQAQMELQRQVAIQNLAIRFSARVFSSPLPRFDEALSELLREVAATFDVQAVALTQFSSDRGTSSMTHAWSEDDATRLIEASRLLPVVKMPLTSSQILRGRSRRIDDVFALADIHSFKRDTLANSGIRAALDVPLRGVNGEVEGFLSLYCTTQARTWTDGEDGQLQVLAGLVATAVDSYTHQLEVNESEVMHRQMAESNARLLEEVNHRVRNNLASILSLLSLSTAGRSSVQSYVSAVHSRVMAMARTHDLLSQSNWRSLDFRTLADEVLTAVSGGEIDRDRLTIGGPAAKVDPERAGSLALTLQELFTNARKHGALSGSSGSVDVAWTVNDDTLVIVWREQCEHHVSPPETRGTGLQLIEGLVEYDLGGSLSLEFKPTGLHCTMAVPMRVEGHRVSA